MAANSQILQMTAFIASEAKDKVAEIRLKTEEDCNIEKLRIVQADKAKVVDDMAKMAKKAETARKVTISAQKSAALMQQVKVRDEAYTNLRNEVLQGLAAVSRDQNKAKDVYAKLIAQCALSLNEKEISIRCVASDQGVVKSAFGTAQSLYSAEVKKAGKPDVGPNFTIDASPLPKEVVGGVQATCNSGKICCDNTFVKRVDQAMNEFKPDIKNMIWTH